MSRCPGSDRSQGSQKAMRRRQACWPGWLLLALASFATAADTMVFPEPLPAKVPDHILLRLNDVHNVSQLFSDFLVIPRGDPLENDNVGRRNNPLEAEAVAAPAGCKPELQVVPLEDPLGDPAVLTWPVCTRVERCGGCCSSPLMHCAPVATSWLHVKAVKARYRPSREDRLEYEGYQTFRIQRHDRCACQCRQSAANCTAAQVYRAEQCRCVCAAGPAGACRGPDHYWDLAQCRCQCKTEIPCSSGFSFSPETCRCVGNAASRSADPEDAIYFPSSEDRT